MRNRLVLTLLALLVASHGCALDWTAKRKAEPDAGSTSQNDGAVGMPEDAGESSDGAAPVEDGQVAPDGAVDDGSTPTPVCTPQAEVCNLADDNCDGRADEALWGRIGTDGARVWTQAAAVEPYSWGQVALAPSPEGGAWFLYSGRADVRLVETRAAKLDTAGVPNGQDVSLGSMGFWTADARDGRLALLYQVKANASDTQSVYLRVFTVAASGLVPLGDPLLILENPDPNSTLGDNENLAAAPIGVSLLEDQQGVLHALTLASKSVPAAGADTIFPTQLRVATLSSGGAWSASSPRQLSTQNLLYFAGLSAAAARVTRIPCRDEWLLVYAAELANSTRDWRIVRVGLAGELVGDPKLDAFVDVNVFVAGLDGLDEGACKQESHVLLAYQQGSASNQPTVLRRWAIDVQSGALRRDGAELDLGRAITMLRAAVVAGKLFVSGAGDAIALWEVAYDAEASQRLREVDLLASGGVNPGSVFGSGTPAYFNSNTPMAGLSNGLVLGYPNGFDSSSNLAANRPAGDTKPAVAVTRVVGCNP